MHARLNSRGLQVVASNQWGRIQFFCRPLPSFATKTKVFRTSYARLRARLQETQQIGDTVTDK